MNINEHIIKKAILAHNESNLIIPIGQEKVSGIIHRVLNNNPEIFWFHHQWTYSREKSVVKFKYAIDKQQRDKIQSQIEDVVQHDFKLDYVRSMPVIEQVMYVYKWIALYCNYSINSAHNEFIHSVFVYRHSACVGISKAAQYLFKLLGIESRLIFGTLNKAERECRPHCWLAINIDGQWYHLDPTFAIPEAEDLLKQYGVEPIKGKDFLFYNFFCVDTATIEQSRIIEDKEQLPKCDVRIDHSLLQEIKVSPSRNGEKPCLGCLLSDVGATADVYLAHDKDIYERNRAVAKVFLNDQDHELLRKELTVMRECAGPHILRVKEADYTKGILYMEQAVPLSLLLESNNFRLTLRDMCSLLTDIAWGIRELHCQGVQYRDLHLNNIYLSEDPVTGKLAYKIGDFGSCIFTDKDDKFIGLTKRGGVGSKWYIAPETWSDGIFDERSSVYGIVMIGYYLLNNLYPPLYREFGQLCCADKRLEGYELSAPVLDFIDDKSLANALSNILCKGLKANPDNRFQTLDELIETISYFSKQIKFTDYTIPEYVGCGTETFAITRSITTLSESETGLRKQVLHGSDNYSYFIRSLKKDVDKISALSTQRQNFFPGGKVHPDFNADRPMPCVYGPPSWYGLDESDSKKSPVFTTADCEKRNTSTLPGIEIKSR